VFIQKQYKIIKKKLKQRRRKKAQLSQKKRHIRKDRLSKAERAEVRLLKQKSSAYRVNREVAQRARP
jgi:hypothetical protein